MQRIIFADVETDMNAPAGDNLVAVCIDGQVYERRVVGDEFLRELFTSIKDEVICGHNIKFDAKVVYQHYGILFENLWCTMVASKLLRNGKKNPDGSPVSNSLVACLEYYLGIKVGIHGQKDEIRTNFSKKRPLTDREIEYIKADVGHLQALQERLAGLVEQDRMNFVFKEEMALIPVLIKKEVKGVRIDTEKLKNYTKVFRRARRFATMLLDREVTALMYRSAKPQLFVNYGYSSTKQVTQIFKDFGFPPPTKQEKKNGRTITKESNDEDALTEYLYEQPESPMKRFIELYLWYKEIEKLISTYGEGMLELVDKDGYLHTEYNQLGAETGRLSSSRINMQNLPANGFGAKIRNCFLPDEGEVFVDTDLDGAEIRIGADLSGDPLLMASITDGVDMHSKLASVSYSVLAGEPVTITKSKEPLTVKGIKLIPDKVRNKNKSTHFSLFYMGGPNRIYTIIGDDIRKFRRDAKVACKEIYTALMGELSVLVAWLRQRIEEANLRGFLRVPKSGRVRYFTKGEAYGDAANFIVQALCAEAIKVAMIRMDKWLTQTGYGRLVLNVHDQLVTSCKPEFAKEVGEMQAKIMSDSLSYFLTNLKGSSGYKITSCWEK